MEKHFPASYIASKFALKGLSLALVQELGPMGIQVKAVFPGPTNTSNFRKEFKTGAKRA